MNEKIAIVCDSGCDISLTQGEELGISIVPLHINYSDKQYRDLFDISPEEVYNRLEQEIPTTSIPSAGEVGEVLDELSSQGYNRFLIITISSGLSGVYQLCSQVLEEKGLIGEVVDTKGIGLLSGVHALYGAKLRNEGRSFSEICRQVRGNVKNAHGFYTIETLKYLRKGGRIGLVTGVLAGVLQLKPIISCNEDGIYYTVAKVRGRKTAIHTIGNLLRKYLGEDPYWMFLCEGMAEEALGRLKDSLKEEVEGASVYGENQITGTLGIHTGPGLVGGVVFTPKEV